MTVRVAAAGLGRGRNLHQVRLKLGPAGGEACRSIQDKPCAAAELTVCHEGDSGGNFLINGADPNFIGTFTPAPARSRFATFEPFLSRSRMIAAESRRSIPATSA